MIDLNHFYEYRRSLLKSQQLLEDIIKRGTGEMKNIHSIIENQENLYTLGPFENKPGDNTEKIEKMKKLIKVIMDQELTERQRQIVELYYLEGKKMPEIADILGTSKQNIEKCLKAAIKKIKKIKNIFEKVNY